MLKSCCFCFNLYQGSVMVGVSRLIHWALVLISSAYVAVEVFSIDYELMDNSRSKIQIEQNSYLLFIMMLVAVLGISAECVLLYSLVKGQSDRVGVWYAYTLSSFVLSIVLAVNFILGVLEVTYAYGDNLVADAACALVSIATFLVPETFWGPRLYTVMMAMLLIIHLALPIYHVYGYCVVKSYLQARRYGFTFRGAAGAQNANGGGLDGLDGIEAASAPLQTGTITKCGKMLCQKCAIAQGEMPAGAAFKNANGYSTPVMLNAQGKPIETTC